MTSMLKSSSNYFFFTYSTCFLMGPMNQFKKMFASTRIIATILVLVMIGLTLFAAIGVRIKPFCSEFGVLSILRYLYWPLIPLLAEESWSCAAVHNLAITCNDMVLHLLHTICSHCCKEDIHRVHCLVHWPVIISRFQEHYSW